jgi:hypothetical protein
VKTRGFSIVLSLAALSCARCAAPARAPAPPAVDLPGMFADAFREDATGDPREAVGKYLRTVAAAARSPLDPWQVPALEASLDALTTRTMPSLGAASRDAALANRTHEGASIARALARTSATAQGHFARGLLARALVSDAQSAGDPQTAETWRSASGCAREALVVGPLAWAPITGVDEPSPLDREGARIDPSYAAGDAFGTTAAPVAVRGRGCALDLSAESARPGVREVIVDVDVPRAQTVGVVLRAHGAAKLRAAGVVVAERPFELGDGEAAQFARVTVTAGVLRLSARVGTAKENDAVEIDVFGAEGDPLRAHAPAAGTIASARVVGAPAPTGAATDSARPARDEEALLVAISDEASGNARKAERMLWLDAARAGGRPDVLLAYGRAVESASDLSSATRAERARSAYERVLDAWPGSWEAAIAHAVLAGVRRGRDEAGIETLADLDAARAKGIATASPLVDAFDALVSGRERMLDRARAVVARARPALGQTALFADAEQASSARAGAELVAFACDPARVTPRDTLACLDALRAVHDRAGETRELARLRALFGAPSRLLAIELRDALASGDERDAIRAYGAMLPAERTLTAQSLLSPWPPRDGAAAGLLRAAARARDAPAAIAPLLREAGDDPTRDFDGVAERLAAQDRSAPLLSTSATAVLAHQEKYDVAASGLARWVLFDVRRVSGTTDVEQNAQAAAADVWGRGASRALRRRIFKRDGRVIEPERTPHASQAHADLSQLEQGDIVEAIYEGWAIPGDTGDIGIDTPDLLPERTAVHDATIELRLPSALRGALWSHPLLGAPTVRDEGAARLLTWHMVDKTARRFEDGVPRMDRSVGVSFSTATWPAVARALREAMGALGEHDPEIAAWAHDVVAAEAPGAGTAPPDARASVDRIVAASGKALREAEPGTLSDYGGGIAAEQVRTARSFLTSHGGSRSWLVVRGLRELGIACDVVVAENEPFSADPSFPPHFGRFAHPLVVARVDRPTGPEEVWIDADVQGPPLPAGRVSPELRGRLALHTDGSIATLPARGSGADDERDQRDEVDVRLVVDERGDARGTFAVVLRGRDAQELSEAFVRIVGAERQRALRDVVLAWLPWANVDDVELASSEASWQVGLRATVSVGGYAQPGSRRAWILPGLDTLHWSWPRARVSSLGATFATRGGRESALALGSAVQYHVHRRVELPKGASVERLPGPVDVRSRLVEASRSFVVSGEGRVVEDDFLLGVATGTIAAKDYDSFVSIAHAADDGFLASTRVARGANLK